jgi:branched-chain amino acid transport system permease protein
MFGYGFFIDNLDISAAIIAAILVGGLIAFAQYTKQGRAMRAVADDHQAALSVGIKLNYVWVLVWSLAAWSRWSRASCGARNRACSSRSA